MKRNAKEAQTEMERSWLVQRLQKPHGGSTLLGLDNPFAFGGGYVNGGLSPEAMGLLRGIFSFDYMGSAEFEFGALPAALSEIAKHADELTAYSFEIALADVQPDWRERDKPAPEGSGTVYVLCRKGRAGEVEKRVRSWAKKDYQLKESVNLARTLRPANEWDGRTQGWLELDNGFFFFADGDMWEQTARLFGVETVAVSS